MGASGFSADAKSRSSPSPSSPSSSPSPSNYAFFYFAVANVMYMKINRKRIIINHKYIYTFYIRMKMDSRISTNGSGKNDAEDFFFFNSCFSIFIYHLLFLSYDHVDHRYK